MPCLRLATRCFLNIWLGLILYIIIFATSVTGLFFWLRLSHTCTTFSSYQTAIWGFLMRVNLPVSIANSSTAVTTVSLEWVVLSNRLLTVVCFRRSLYLTLLLIKVSTWLLTTPYRKRTLFTRILLLFLSVHERRDLRFSIRLWKVVRLLCHKLLYVIIAINFKLCGLLLLPLPSDRAFIMFLRCNDMSVLSLSWDKRRRSLVIRSI